MEKRYPGERPGVFRISNSTIETYLKCGVRYQFEQEERHRRATVAMVIGTAVAGGAQYDLDCKLNRERSASGQLGAELDDIIDVSVSRYELEAEDSEMVESKFEIMSGVDSVRDAARAYGIQVSPTIDNVVAAESAIIAVIDPDLELAGRPDCIQQADGEAGIVRDLKTGRPWTQERVDASRQMTGYSILHEARFGRPPDRVVIDSLSPDRSGRWKAKTFWSSRSEADRDAYVELARRTRKAMAVGIYLPAPAMSWWCSARWCPFHKKCEFFKE